LAASANGDAAASLPNWARFVMGRRALEDFYAFVRHGKWTPLGSSVTKQHLDDTLNTLRMARASPALARRRMEQFRMMSPLHAELVRRFLEPALGVIPAEHAQLGMDFACGIVVNLEYSLAHSNDSW
jgi:hypothetical protein